MGVQAVRHICMVCPLLQDIREKYEIDSVEKGVGNDDFLMEMECILGIKNRVLCL